MIVLKVRGAPAIAVVGCLSLAVELRKLDSESTDSLCKFVVEKLDYLVTARPTAVNIGKAAEILKSFVCKESQKTANVGELKMLLVGEIEVMLENDIKDNMNIGNFGADHILKSANGEKVKVLTHCNTGSLATVKYGTALGVVRSLQDKGKYNYINK